MMIGIHRECIVVNFVESDSHLKQIDIAIKGRYTTIMEDPPGSQKTTGRSSLVIRLLQLLHNDHQFGSQLASFCSSYTTILAILEWSLRNSHAKFVDVDLVTLHIGIDIKDQCTMYDRGQ